jgi:predicted Zn-dependent protease
VTWNRREVLAALGVGAAHALLGCASSQAPVVRPSVDPGEVRTWLRDAVARLHAAGFTHAHALAVTRRRTSAALDVLGAGVSRSRADGVVLTTGTAEQVTSDLSRAGVLAAARALAGKLPAAGTLAFGPPAPHVAEPHVLADHELLDRVATLAARDQDVSSRIVYSAALIELDEAHVWAIGPGHDLEQYTMRVRRVVTRVAWNSTRPIVREVARAWAGEADARELSDADVIAAREHALLLTTPTAFPDGEHAVALEPSVVAVLVDAMVRALLTSSAVQPEVARRMTRGRALAAPVLTLVDDPASAGAYGGFAFDDRGVRAAPTTLLDRGKVAGVLVPRRRAGHLGRLEATPSHLRLAPGTAAREGLLADGFELEGGIRATVDPASERVVIAAARAYELKGGTRTGRVYADIELVGELAPLLASVTAATATTASFGMRDEIDHRPRFRSIEAPWLRARATLRARRGLS